jgi:hypothetical protein
MVIMIVESAYSAALFVFLILNFGEQIQRLGTMQPNFFFGSHPFLVAAFVKWYTLQKERKQTPMAKMYVFLVLS